MVASLGKAIGITGGVIASDQLFINQQQLILFQVLE
jgi:7-keto-8-aminopelargonate synthetase-like enzyme